MAQDFERGESVPMPEADLNTGGLGNMVSNVDIDEDGKTDLFVVAHNWNDADSEMLPRIYKYERNADNAAWDIVWQASFDVWKQNTWPGHFDHLPGIGLNLDLIKFFMNAVPASQPG